LATDEVPFLAEVIVEGGVNRGEFLQGLRPAETVHRPLSSSEGEVAVLSSVVLPPTHLLALLGAQIGEGRLVNASPFSL